MEVLRTILIPRTEGPPPESPPSCPLSRNVGLRAVLNQGRPPLKSLCRKGAGSQVGAVAGSLTHAPGALRVKLERQHAGEYSGHSRVISGKVRGASHGLPSGPDVTDVIRSRFDSDESWQGIAQRDEV